MKKSRREPEEFKADRYALSFDIFDKDAPFQIAIRDEHRLSSYWATQSLSFEEAQTVALWFLETLDKFKRSTVEKKES